MVLRKDVMRLTLPVLAEQAFIMLMGVVNTIMASHLGKEAISAIGMIDSINNIIIAFFSAFAVGGTVIVAQNFGSMNLQGANKAALNAIFSGLIIAVTVTVLLAVFKRPMILTVFHAAEPLVIQNTLTYFNITLLTYPFIALMSIIFGVLRGAGNTKAPMKITITMNVFNVICSYLLIYGLEIGNNHLLIRIPSLGIKGAAYGIALARIIGFVMVMGVLLKDFLRINLRELTQFRFSLGTLKTIFNIGIPSSLESLMFNGGKLITQIFVVGMGTATIAANSISGSIFGLLNIPGSALSIAAIIMVGQFIGKQDTKMATETLRYLIKLGTICLVILCAIIYPFAHFLATIYTQDPEVVRITTMLIKSTVFAMPLLWSGSFILPSGLKGGGDVKYILVVSILGMWLFRLTLGYILAIPLGVGILGIWIAMYVDWFIRSLLFFIRFKSGKWVHKTKLEGN